MAKKKTLSLGSVTVSLLALIPTVAIIIKALISGRAPDVPYLFAACLFLYLAAVAFCEGGTKHSVNIMKAVFSLFFAIFVFTLVNFTLFNGYFGRIPLALHDFSAIKSHAAERTNFIPFATIGNLLKGYSRGNVHGSYLVTNIIGNLAAFAPFAFFVPLLFRKMRSFPRFLVFVSLSVVLIETMQLIFMTGSMDIDDFILNVSGAVILYFFLRLKFMRKLIYKITNLRIQ